MEKNIFTDIQEGEFKECLNIPSQHCCYFKYDAGNKAKLLKFFVEPLDANSDPDIYITADDPGVSQKHYHWKANNIGSVQVNVNPFDPHYTTHIYYICIEATKETYPNSFIFFVHAIEFTELKLLQSDELEEIKLKPKEVKYFQYKLQSLDNSTCLRFLTNSTNVKIFASSTKLFPDNRNYTWTSLKPPEEEVQLNPYPISELADKIVPNELLFLRYDFWSALSDNLYICLQNRLATIQNSKIKIQEMKDYQLLPPCLQTSYQQFKEIFTPLCALRISPDEERKQFEDPEFTYGEIKFEYFWELLRKVTKVEDKEFWDLGCGTGKALVVAAMSGLFEKITGVEYLKGLAEIAEQAAKLSGADIKVMHGDLKKISWQSADVVYIASLCFSVDLMEEIAKIGLLLKPGSRIITLKMFPSSEGYSLAAPIGLKMSWGDSCVYIYTRLS